jgi:Tfp pilus assembly major pilin PilA
MFGGYRLIIIGIAVVGILATVAIHVRSDANARNKITALELQAAQDSIAVTALTGSLDTCRQINKGNRKEAEEQAERAKKAENQVRKLRDEADDQTEIIHGEAQKYRENGLDCPAINDDFRRWMLDGATKSSVPAR